MNIHLLLFLVSHANENRRQALIKTVRSHFRPVAGDFLDDPGFDPAFHNGYEVVKTTINYATEDCWVSLAPIAAEVEELTFDAYVEKLLANGWRTVSKEELLLS